MNDELENRAVADEVADYASRGKEQASGVPVDSPVDPVSNRLCSLALEIYDGTQTLHGLELDSREYLKAATRLHSLPIQQAKKKPFTAALRLIHSQSGLDLDDHSQRMVAAVLLALQNRLKYKELGERDFTPAQQQAVWMIAAILQVAEGISKSCGEEATIAKIVEAEDELWIVLSGIQTASDLAGVSKNANLWQKLGCPDLRVLLQEQANLRSKPFPDPLEKIGIHPYDLLSEAGRKVMRFHFAEMLRHEEETRLGVDIEALHDMRVATRRLRAAFEVFAPAFEKKALKPHLDGLRMTGRTLGAVRDMDVFMEKAQKYLQNLPEERRSGLDPLLEHWRQQRDAAREVMTAFLDSKAYRRFKRDFNVFLNTPFAGASAIQTEPPEPTLVRHIAPVLIYTRLASVRAFETHLEAAPIERLHMLRIEFKKLRYTVEYFQEVLGRRSLEVIETIKVLQDHLGDLNDAQVATQILGDFIAGYEKEVQEAPISERENLAEVVSYLAYRHAERHRLLSTFNEVWTAQFDQKRFRRRMAQAVALL